MKRAISGWWLRSVAGILIAGCLLPLSCGRTDRSPEERAKELSSQTGAVGAFIVGYQRTVQDVFRGARIDGCHMGSLILWPHKDRGANHIMTNGNNGEARQKPDRPATDAQRRYGEPLRTPISLAAPYATAQAALFIDSPLL